MANSPGSARRNVPGQLRFGPLWLLAATVVALLISALALPSLVLIILGLLPTAFAASVDRHPLRLLTWSVAPLDLAVTLQYALQLWRGANDFGTAMRLMAAPRMWVIILGASAFGWALYQVLPSLVRWAMAALLRRRVVRIDRMMASLREEWGDAVSEPLPRRRRPG